MIRLFLTLAYAYKTSSDFISEKRDRCTSMVFGKYTTAHGGPVATHGNDCADCDARIAYVKGYMNKRDSLRPVYDGTNSLYPRIVSKSRSSTYEPVNGFEETVPIGYVPQSVKTLGMYESFYPLLNSAGVGMGESTTQAKVLLANQINSHFVPDTNNTQKGVALFTIGELMRVALEQESSARAVIRKAGQLCMDYGFGGEEWGTAETVTVVDSVEAWVMEIAGSGLGNTSCLWVAQRVPDDHVAIVANNMIIKEVDLLDDGNMYMYSSNLVNRTKELGIYKTKNLAEGSEKSHIFLWYESVGQLIPLPQYAALRAWRIYSQLSPSIAREYNPNPEYYPFSAQLELPNKLSIAQIMNLHRDYYQGTEFDMTQGVLAGPFGSPSVEMPGLPRAISIMRTSYTAIVAPQGETLSKVWIGLDQAATSVFVPFYALAMKEGGGNGEFDSSFGSPYGPAQQVFNRTTAWWAFDFVANWMNINYRNMSLEEVYPARDALQQWVFDEVDRVESSLGSNATENSILLASAQKKIQKHVTKTWWELADNLIVRYNDGFLNFGKHFPNRVVPINLPTEWLHMVGFNADFIKPGQHWLMPAGIDARELANSQVLIPQPNCVGTTYSPPDSKGTSYGQIITVAIAIAMSFLAGRFYGEKRRQKTHTEPNVYNKLL